MTIKCVYYGKKEKTKRVVCYLASSTVYTIIDITLTSQNKKKKRSREKKKKKEEYHRWYERERQAGIAMSLKDCNHHKCSLNNRKLPLDLHLDLGDPRNVQERDMLLIIIACCVLKKLIKKKMNY